MMDPVPPGPLACDGCRKPGDITWCPAWNTWLCGACRHIRTDVELGTTPAPSPLPGFGGPGTP